MQKKFTLFFLLIFCLFYKSIDAQVTFTAANQTASCEDTDFCVDVEVSAFTNVSSMQFQIEWDTALMHFTGITVNLPPSGISNTMNSDSGYVTFSWAHGVFPPGLTLADASTIMTLCFDQTGVAGMGSLAFVDGLNTPISVTVGLGTQLTLGTDLFFNDATINITDIEAPMIACPGDITVTSGTAINGLAPSSFSDNCTIDAVNYTLSGATTGSGMDDASGSVFNTGMTTVTYQILDMGGNMETCSFVVTAEVPPVANLEFIPLVDFDCDNNIINLAMIVNNFQDLGSMQFTVSWEELNLNYVSHVNMLPASATFNTSFVNTGILPLFWLDGTPPFDGLSLSNGDTIFTASFSLIGTYAPPIFSIVDLPTLPIEVADNNSIPLDPADYDFLPEVITITDTNDPSFGATCPMDMSIANDAGLCGANALWIAPTATDACDPTVAITSTHNSGDFFPLGATVVTYTATDDSGNTAECSFTVTVQDAEDPTITCPSDTTISAGAGTSVLVTNLAAVANDNCSVSSIVFTQNGATTGSGNNDASGVYDVGTTTVTYTATDAAGNTAECSFTVTVTTLPPPNISCPGTITTNTNAGTCTAVIVSIAPFSLTDPAAISSITYTLTNATTGSGNDDASGTLFNVGTTTVTYILTDTAGQVAMCNFDVNVSDLEIPSMLCPSVDVFVNQPDSCNVVVTNNIAPIVSDNCGVASIDYVLTGAMTGSGMNTATGLTFPVGSTDVTYTATDVNGNTNQCTVTVVVNDNQLPTLSCPNDTTVFAPFGMTTATPNNIDPIVSDNCGIPSVTFQIENGAIQTGTASGSTFDMGISEVTYFVTDGAGNIDSCSFRVTVIPAPVGDLVDCPADVVVDNDGNQCQALVNGIAPIFLVDPLTIQTVEYTLFNINGTTNGINDASGLDYPVGITTVQYIVNDVNNVADTCTFTVTVNDVMVPVWANCPDTVFVAVNVADCRAIASWNEPIPGDNCAVINISRTNMPSDTFPLGETIVTYTAFDAAGNSADCSFPVIVSDEEAPSITCPVDFTYVNIGNCQAIVNWIVPVPTDNCPNVTLTSTHTPGDTFDLGIPTPVIYFAIDGAGLTDQCTFEITVPDTLSPIISNCPTDTIIVANPGLCSAIYSWTEPTGFDNCLLTSFTASAAPGAAFPVGINTVVYTAMDAAGNSVDCSFLVTVIDTLGPVLNCPADIEIRLDGTIVSDPSGILVSTSPTVDCDGIKISFTEPVGLDNCVGNIPSVFESGVANGGTFPLGTTTQTFIATDTSGNSDTCTFEIRVLNLEAVIPGIIGGNDVCLGSNAQFTVTPSPGATYAWTGPAGWTATGPTPSRVEITQADAGEYIVICTSASGCTSTGSVILNVLPAPMIEISSNSPICTDGSNTLVLMANPASGSVTVTSWSWTGPDAFNSIDQNPVIPNADASNSGLYTVVATSSNGCTSSQTLSVDVVELLPPTIESDCSEVACEGQRCFLLGTQFLPTPDQHHWTVSPAATGGLPADANTNETYFEPSAPGIYIINYWVSSNGCVSDTATLVVTVEGAPKTVSDQSDVVYETPLEGINVLWNDSISSSDGVIVILASGVSNGTLDLQSDGVFNYTPDNGFLGEDQFTYQVCSTCDLTQCATGVVTLTVLFDSDECEVPSVITPNGDGKNDDLFINCLDAERFPTNSIEIYNEWGDKVYSASPYLNDWQGTYNGDDLPDGTYFYLFRTDGSAEVQKGYVTIFR